MIRWVVEAKPPSENTGGSIEYTENNWRLPMLNNFILAITGGSVERDENGQMCAILKTLSPFASVQKLNDKIGMSDIQATSSDSVISTDFGNPTRFVSQRRVIFPQGERVLNLLTLREEIIRSNLVCDTETLAEGALTGHSFSGSFYVKIAILARRPLEAAGKFELYVA